MTVNAAHLRAVQVLEEEATGVVVGALADVLKGVTDVIRSVTAAAADQPPAEPFLSADDLAHIQTGWTVAVDGTILPWYHTVYVAGADAAIEQIAELREAGAVAAVDIIGDDAVPLLLNEAATRHLASARNRFLAVGQDTWEAARTAMLTGFAAGEGIDPIQARLRDVVDVSRAQATAVARTEVISASNAGAITRVRAMGSDAPKFKRWLATNDARTRPTHSAANNQAVPLGDKFTVGGAALDYPADPSGPDDEVINCRCTPIFIDDPDQELGEDLDDITEGVVGLVAAVQPLILAKAAEYRRTFNLADDAKISYLYDGQEYAVSRNSVQWVGPVHWDAQSLEGIDSTTGQPHTGSMIALVPADPESLTVHGGESPEQLHVTLWFLGEAADMSDDIRAGLTADVADVAALMAPIEAQAFGAAVWNPNGETPCCVLSIGGAGLQEARDDLGDVVDGVMASNMDWQMPDNHTPWVAHMCVAYSDDPAAVLPEALSTVGPVLLDTIRLTFGDEVLDFPMGGDKPEDKPAASYASAQVSDTESGDISEADMPYGIRKGGADCPFEVYNSDTDERAPGGCHATRQEALDHQRALMVHVPDADTAAADETDCPPGHHRMPDGECMPDDEMPTMAAQPGEHFHAIMHTQGVSTGLRTFNDLSWRSPPFAYHWQRSSSAHGGMPETIQVGLVTRVEADPDDPAALHAWGRLDLDGEIGAEYARQLVGGWTRWVSIGLDEQPTKETIVWPEGAGDDDVPMFAMPDQVIIDGGRIGELTSVSVPAQDDATVEPTEELTRLLSDDASAEAAPIADLPEPQEATIMDPEASMADVVQGITAAAHRIEIPDLPPAWWFQEPTDVDITSAFNITDDGRIYAALAPLGVGHRAFVHSGRRQEVPFGNVDYSRFMGAWALTQSGRVAAGPVTMDCGHANRFRNDHDQAPAHYENACTVVAMVCVGESKERGVVWAAGALMPAVTVDQVSRMLACRLSGDWQSHPDKPGWQELVAALLVPSPGFPMAHTGPQVEYEDGVLVASSVPVHAVGAGGRPRLRVDARTGTVARVSPPTPKEQVAAVVSRVRGV